jgi:hypothetical protein
VFAQIVKRIRGALLGWWHGAAADVAALSGQIELALFMDAKLDVSTRDEIPGRLTLELNR